jgi:thiamine transporter
MKNQTKELVWMAMYLALFVVLDYLANLLPIFKMPNGGTLGLGTIPLILASYHLGWKKGVIVGVLSVALQFLTGQMYVVDFFQFLLEYLFAFGIYGICCLFPTWKWFYSGVAVTNLIRLCFHWVAGVLYWKTTWWASLVYQCWYMIPTMILGLVLVPLIMKALPKKETVKS